MTLNFRYEWLLIGLLTLIMLIKGVVWSLAFPLWQGPDEEDHYAVIQFIAELGRLPDAADTFLPDEIAISRELADVGRLPYAPEQRQGFVETAVHPNETQFAQLDPATRTSFDKQMVGKLNKATPFYYALASLVYRLFPDGDLLERAQIQRLFAVLISSPIVAVAYLIARRLFPTDAAMRLTIPTLVTFHPQLTHITSVVSVDGFYFVCYSLLIYLSLRVLQTEFNWRNGLAIGLVFVVGVLTKPTLNGYAPLVALLVVYDWLRSPSRRRDIFWAATAMGTLITIPLGWWMLRSLRINNDLFYFNPVTEGHRIIQNPFYDYAVLPHMLDYYQSVWGGIFTTWWAHFGWLDTALPPWVYTSLRGLTWLAMAGLLVGLVRLWRRPPAPTLASWRAGETTAPVGVWAFLALGLLVPILLLQFYDLIFWWQYGNGRGLQGRYWLGTIVPMLTFFAVGLLLWLPKRWHPVAHTWLRVGMVVFNIVSLLGYILPRYYL
ncbi:MAG: glycosyltransferase family 39 protein [Chloroflexota bacterium]